MRRFAVVAALALPALLALGGVAGASSPGADARLTSAPDKKGNTTRSFGGDTCPHAGGLDQNIDGDLAP